MRPRIEIAYCPRCRWLPRAAWLAQELLGTFADEIGEVALRPAGDGVFEVRVDGEPVFDRKQDGGLPDASELKRRVRDRIAPGRDLGHLDRAARDDSGAR